MHTAVRYHDFSAGHRVVGHENKCALLHGHNYRVHFHCRAVEYRSHLDSIGRVIDFSVIKDRLCVWLEDNWDHKFLVWQDDDMLNSVGSIIDGRIHQSDASLFHESLTHVSFNPTAENMAEYLVKVVGPRVLEGTHVELFRCVVEETRKCSATYELEER